MSELSDELMNKKIIDFTDEELVQAGFAGDGVRESIISAIRQIKENPNRLGFIDGFMMNSQKNAPPAYVSAPSISPTPSDSSTVSVSSDGALTAVDPDLVCEFEKYNYYIGLCANDEHVPLLYYRTNLDTVPFPMPSKGMKWFKVPHKTANGPFDKVLTRQLWGKTVGPMIITRVLDARGIKYQSLEATRFSTRDEAGKVTLGPIVIWIGTHRGTTTPKAARDASPDILRILLDHGVNGAEVEWYEGRV